MPKETKADAASKEARVNKVYELLIGGATRFQLWQYVSTTDKGKELFKGVSRRTLDRYTAEANAMIAAESEWLRPRELGKAVARLNDLYQRCMKVQDYQRALAVQRELNTLLGLHAPPPAQTIKLMGVDPAELTTVLQALQDNGLKASDVFHAMLAELMRQKT